MAAARWRTSRSSWRSRIRSRRSCRTWRRPRGPTPSSPPAALDFPNQVNNVLCFPFIFRGALDVGATTINEAMKLACVRAIADLAMAEQSDIVAHAYNIEDLRFGPEYLIPKPFDPRLIMMIAPAVAKAAMDSGVATRPIADFDAYRERLTQFVLLLRPADEADLHGREEGSEADRVRGGRGRARAARRAGRRGRGPRAADPGRPAAR